MIIVIVLAVIILAVVGWALATYNLLIRLRNLVKNGWAQIDVQLKRRYDLIPNLVEVAKGYMTHERETLENVIKARSQAIETKGVKKQAEAENFLTQTLRSLFAVVENYPNLKANQNMRDLHEELTSTENKISFSRQYYNDEVTRYNTRIQSVPINIVAGIFSFTPNELFEVTEESQREGIKVKF